MRHVDVEDRVLNAVSPVEVAEFLAELVRTPSVFPPGDCRDVARLCMDRLEGAGLSVRTAAVEPYLPNLLIPITGGDGPLLVYSAHMDTVAPGDLSEWHYDPFGAELAEGRLYGRGAGDDKGSLAAQVMAAVALARAGVRLRGTLLVCPVSHEEAGGYKGMIWLRAEGIVRPDLLVVGEQTNNHVAITERARCFVEITVHGKAAHGAMPWLGHNAIHDIAHVIVALETRLAPALAARAEAYLPPSTMNIGTVTGGQQTNVVPDRCVITIDRRLTHHESCESTVTEIREILDEISHTRGFRYDLAVTKDTGPMYFTSPDSALVQAMQSAVAEACGEPRPCVGYMQGSDAGRFAQDGFPIVVFGPGDPALGHAPDEFVSVAQVVEAARVYALTAVRVLHGS